MGLSFASARNTVDVQVYADGYEKTDTLMQTLHKGFCRQQSRCHVLFTAVQKQIQCLQEQGKER